MSRDASSRRDTRQRCCGSATLLSANVKRRTLRGTIHRLLRQADDTRIVSWAKRRPEHALWLFVFLVVALNHQVWTGPPPGPEHAPTEHGRWLEQRARDQVPRVLRVIGHDIRISEVVAVPLDESVMARFGGIWARIEVNSNVVFSDIGFQVMIAHECVHALFDQAGIGADVGSPTWSSQLLWEETAAYVLGAHIAGEVLRRQGGDGEALTRRSVALYREACDWSSEKSMRRKLWEEGIERGVDSLDLYEAYSIAIHFGSPEMVDRVDEICREHPDPWDAAHAVAAIYREAPGSS